MTEYSKFLQARILQLETALTMMYDKWENGDGCYEDPDTCSGFLGNAFKLSQEEENQILALVGTPSETSGVDADGHCVRCGLEVEDPKELAHECPPGFTSETPAKPLPGFGHENDMCKCGHRKGLHNNDGAHASFCHSCMCGNFDFTPKIGAKQP